MEYFPPKSFLILGKGSSHKDCRFGNFTIEPVNNQYSSEFYWVYTCRCEDGKFEGAYYQSAPWGEGPKPKTISPKFDTEEQVVRWLESAFIQLSKEKVAARNQELINTIKQNKKFVRELERGKCQTS